MSDIYERIMRITGTEVHAGSPGDPPEPRTLYYHDGAECDPKDPEAYVISPNNDGQEVWFGTLHRWDNWLSADDVLLLTRWLIVDRYIKARWLGLRRPIYYWALRRHLAAWRRKTGDNHE